MPFFVDVFLVRLHLRLYAGNYFTCLKQVLRYQFIFIRLSMCYLSLKFTLDMGAKTIASTKLL